MKKTMLVDLSLPEVKMELYRRLPMEPEELVHDFESAGAMVAGKWLLSYFWLLEGADQNPEVTLYSITRHLHADNAVRRWDMDLNELNYLAGLLAEMPDQAEARFHEIVKSDAFQAGRVEDLINLALYVQKVDQIWTYDGDVLNQPFDPENPDVWRRTLAGNERCAEMIRLVTRNAYNGWSLDDAAARRVLEMYGPRRTEEVLAATIQYLDGDGRISRENRQWAAGMKIAQGAENPDRIKARFHVNVHPGLLDLFTSQVRELSKEFMQPTITVGDVRRVYYDGGRVPYEYRLWDRAVDLEAMWMLDYLEAQDDGFREETETPKWIARYYVVHDVYGEDEQPICRFFANMDSALAAYAELPNHLDKQIGMESTERVPSRMPLITCRNGIEELNSMQVASLSGKWINTETLKAIKQAKTYLKEQEPEIAYKIGERFYLLVQEVPEGYDYVIYDTHFKDVDDGILDRPGTIEQAIDEIVDNLTGRAHPPLKVIDKEQLKEQVNAAWEQGEEKPNTPQRDEGEER